METDHSDKSSDEPNAKRPKMETEASSSAKSEATDDYSPISTLPPDILAKIIVKIPVARWPALESMDQNFRAATWIAWRQLRRLNVDRELLIKPNNEIDQSLFGGETVTSVELILRKLVERSPFMSSICGIDIRSINAELNTDVVCSLLAQFENLQSISLGDPKFTFDDRDGPPLEAVVEFLESTRSRASLKELQLYNVVQPQADRTTILDRFSASFVTGREIQSPLKLEKFSFTSTDYWLRIRLDNIDTTRLTDIRLGKAGIEPDQLTNLIERALNLRRIELSFLRCLGRCNGPRLQANKKLLSTLASHENLTAINLGSYGDGLVIDRRCTNFKFECIEMLETIGRRGQLRKLALNKRMLPGISTDGEICATICKFIPYLQSIELCVGNMNNHSVVDLVSLMELEDINVSPSINASAVEKVAQLPRLKRLTIGWMVGEKTKLMRLADAPTLMDLRIRSAYYISAEVLDKWSDGFAPNLQILILSNIDDDAGVVRLLKKSVRLRVLFLHGTVTDRSVMATAESCSDLETFSVESYSKKITVRHLQEIVNRCPKLKRLGGFHDEIRKQLQFPKYRKIGVVDTMSRKFDVDSYDFDFD